MGRMSTGETSNVDNLWEEYFRTGSAEVKNQIISHYIYLVAMVVKRLMPHYKDYSEKDELMSCGVIGLIDAVNKFDMNMGVKFQTYASLRIRGEIIDYLRKQDWAPTSLRKKINSIHQAYEILEKQLGRLPTDEEIAKFLGEQVSRVRKVLQKAHMFNLIHFESMLYEKETEEHFSSPLDDPYHIIENKSMKSALRDLVESLPEREKMVITLHYYKGLTMKSIAEILNISESRVSQIHSKVLMDMRKALEA
jgi:RNA polymerase sigma factor for flagellar operon FliA